MLERQKIDYTEEDFDYVKKISLKKRKLNLNLIGIGLPQY